MQKSKLSSDKNKSDKNIPVGGTINYYDIRHCFAYFWPALRYELFEGLIEAECPFKK